MFVDHYFETEVRKRNGMWKKQISLFLLVIKGYVVWDLGEVTNFAWDRIRDEQYFLKPVQMDNLILIMT